MTGAVGPMTLTFPSTSAGPGPTSAALKFYKYFAEIAIPLRLMLIPVFHMGMAAEPRVMTLPAHLKRYDVNHYSIEMSNTCKIKD